LIYIFKSNFGIFQTLSANLFDLNPWIIIQIPIFENTQKSSLKSFKFPF
jgi:hypothetical protein